jgi:uncharacterized protein (TIGR03118 family)
MRNWIHTMMRATTKPFTGRRRNAPRLTVELLETRQVLSNVFLQTNLVSDISGVALNTDPKLINPWGIAAAPGGPMYVANNGNGTVTTYNGAGVSQNISFNIPGPGGTDSIGAPDGEVFNGSQAFDITLNGATAPAEFLYATEDGTIAGYNPAVSSTQAVLAVNNNASGAVYKGLAIGTDPDGRTLLYVANFNSGQIDVFDSKFQPTTVGGNFTDPNLPTGYAPFNIANIDGQLYVSYAVQDAAKHDDVAGAGLGIIDVFSTNGTFEKRLVSNVTPQGNPGPLDAPWAMVLAPKGFGNFGGDLLVGNFGSGQITAVNPFNGNVMGTLTNAKGNAITIGGLWGLQFGNGSNGANTNTLYFTAGINHENDGLFGQIQNIEPVTIPTTANPKATDVLQTNLVSNVAGIALTTDANLVNPWGEAAAPGGPFWVSDNGSGLSTLYNGEDTVPGGNTIGLVVNIPGGKPTGIVANSDSLGFFAGDSTAGTPVSADFIFASETGTISAWNPAVNVPNALHNAVSVVSNPAASYTGLAQATDGTQTLLYAANHNAGGTIDVYNASFQAVNLGPNAFVDPNGTTVNDNGTAVTLTPYGIQAINGMLYVTYSAPRGTFAGNGIVDEYTTNGTFVMRIGTGGALNEPWGMAIAPKTFGAFGGDLLVGNVGDGHISIFNPNTGTFLGQLTDGLGNDIAIPGLWNLSFGNGADSTSTNTLYFTAGIGGYRDGLLGELQAIEPVKVVPPAATPPHDHHSFSQAAVDELFALLLSNQQQKHDS